jgi:HAE1 family hydrophobic/amphiphilic exporter-1
MHFTLRFPFLILGGSLGLLVLSLIAAKTVPKTFLPAQDNGEFSITLELAPGSSLDATQKAAFEVDKIVRHHPEVDTSLIIVGNADGEANLATFFVRMTATDQRKITTTQLKEQLRAELAKLTYANPIVKDYDPIGGGQRPFNVVVIGDDLNLLDEFSAKLFSRLKTHPALTDPETSYKPGKPEYQVVWDNTRGDRLGVSSRALGLELRTQVEGTTPAVFRENGREYDIRVRLAPEQRDLRPAFDQTFIPNVNGRLVRLRDVAHAVSTSGPATIQRRDRGRAVTIGADMKPDGPGMGVAMQDIDHWLGPMGDLKLPPGLHYAFVGQAQNFQELVESMVIAIGLAVLFIYLVLASLYESFITPFTIMLVLPLAMCGAFFALALTHKSLDIFSMIGCVMLLGIATKNSILLVDYTSQKMREGLDRTSAILEAGRVRLRPILMTSVALIAGMLPVAIGLDEASRQRTSMGVAIIGGLITSTLLSLVVVPAAFSYIDNFRLFMNRMMGKLRGQKASPVSAPEEADEEDLAITTSP